jgi:hypothetical protein
MAVLRRAGKADCASVDGFLRRRWNEQSGGRSANTKQAVSPLITNANKIGPLREAR